MSSACARSLLLSQFHCESLDLVFTTVPSHNALSSSLKLDALGAFFEPLAFPHISFSFSLTNLLFLGTTAAFVISFDDSALGGTHQQSAPS